MYENAFENVVFKIAIIMRQLTTPSLVQIMACRLLGAKPLSEPMLAYC